MPRSFQFEVINMQKKLAVSGHLTIATVASRRMLGC